MPNPLNTIASIGSINTPIPQTQMGPTAPTTRSGGQPLQNGDRWFNTDTSSESFYYDGQWVVISQSGGGPAGPPGPEGPTAVSVDVNNYATLGSDSLIFVPQPPIGGNVTSVNGETGEVVLTYGDVGAASDAQGTKADTAIQPGGNISELINNVNYVVPNNYLWSNIQDNTITEELIAVDVPDWANATKIYVHRKAKNNIDMKNTFNNSLLKGSRVFIQKTNDAEKFFIATIDSSFPIITGTGTDQVFEYSVINVSTTGAVFNDGIPVSFGIYADTNAYLVNQAIVASGGGGGVTTDDVNNIITDRRQSTTRVDISETALWVGEAAPVVDPGGRPGWYFANNGNKIQWALWTNDLEAEKQFTYSEMKSASLVIRNSGTMYPYFSVYTRRKNDGNDYNVSYRSRYSFEINQNDSGSATKTRLLTTLANNPINENIPHRVATLQAFSSVGPQEPDEIVKSITLGSGSGSPVGTYDFVASELIIDTSGEMFTIELNATPVIDSNTSRMYYQATAPAVLGRKDGDFWYDTANTTLNIWTGSSWTAL